MAKIIYVDNSEIITSTMKLLARQHSFQVVTFNTAEAALAAIQRGEMFDAVISDGNLGRGMSGWEFADKLKNDGVHQPLILYSTEEANKGKGRFDFSIDKYKYLSLEDMVPYFLETYFPNEYKVDKR